MNNVINKALEVAKEVDPNSPLVQAAVNTIADPSAANILADAELAINLAKQLKAVMTAAHPSLSKLIKALLF